MKISLNKLVKEVKKAIPEVNENWVKEHLQNETDGNFTKESINTWIEHFKQLINE